MRIQNKFVTTALCVGATFVFATTAFAQDANDRYVLRIDGGKLGKVVDDVHEQTDLEFIYSFDLVNADGINPVNGRYTLDEALAIMFEGTGLSGGLTDSGMIVITRESGAQAQTPGDDKMISNNTKKSLLASVSALILGAVQAPALAQDNGASPQPGVQNVNAAPGVIVGHVTDVNSGAPLAGAILVLEGTRYTASTNGRGEYRFPNVPSGDYVLNIDYLGSPSQSMNISVGNRARNVQNFALGSVVDEIVTIGTRSSLAQALNQQRSAPNSSTIISADLLNSFSAETVSEALRRVSGVTFSRDDDTGEGARVAVRGFNADAINVQLNGLELQGTGLDRGIDLSGFLADNISTVTIHKSLLPSHESSGSGGLIEIETRSGLDFGEQYLSVGIEREQGFSGGFGDELQANITVAKTFADNFGISANLQYRTTDRINIGTTNIQNFQSVLPEGISNRFLIPESLGPFPLDDLFSEPLRSAVIYNERTRDEENLTGSINVAWDISDHTALRFDVQRSNLKSNLTSSISRLGFNTTFRSIEIPELGGAVRQRDVLRAIQSRSVFNEAQSDLTSTTYSFRGDTNIGPWEFEYKAGLAKSVDDRSFIEVNYIINSDLFSVNPERFLPSNFFGTLDGAVSNPQANSTRIRDVSDGVLPVGNDGLFIPNFNQAAFDIVNNPAEYFIDGVTLADGRSVSDAKTLELRTRYNFSETFFDYIELGGRFNDNERTNPDDALSGGLRASQIFVRPNFFTRTFLPDFGIDTFTGTLDLSSIGATGFSIPVLQLADAQSIAAQVANLTVNDPNTPENEFRFRVFDNTGDPIQNAGAISPSTVREKKYAGWIQSKITLDKLEVVGGVRFEQVDVVSAAISASRVFGVDGLVSRAELIDAGLVNVVDTSGRTTTWTPSLLATYRQSDNLVLRGAYFRSTTNPSLVALSGSQSIFINSRPGSERVNIIEANPNLDPTTVDNFDLDFSYFFKDNPGLIRIGAFYKKTSNNFTNVSSQVENEVDLRAQVIDIFAPLQAVNPDAFAAIQALPADTAFARTRQENGEGGDIFGVELELIRQLDFFPEAWPEYLNNFSVLGNVTYTTGNFATNVPARDENGAITISLDRFLLGQSEWAGNASVRYDDGKLSGSLIYTFQSASVDVFDPFDLNEITPKFSTLDFRLQYALGDEGNKGQYTFFLEADDLLKGRQTADVRSAISSQFGRGSSEFTFPRSLLFNGGRTFTVGVRARF